jgi:hypothetical protein
LAQGYRVERRDMSSAIWGTPDVLPTWSQRQHLTRRIRRIAGVLARVLWRPPVSRSQLGA